MSDYGQSKGTAAIKSTWPGAESKTWPGRQDCVKLTIFSGYGKKLTPELPPKGGLFARVLLTF